LYTAKPRKISGGHQSVNGSKSRAFEHYLRIVGVPIVESENGTAEMEAGVGRPRRQLYVQARLEPGRMGQRLG